jgi:hypothetical protein
MRKVFLTTLGACNWFFVPDDSFVSIDTGCACREYDECPEFFEARL